MKPGDLVTFRKDGTKCKVDSISRGSCGTAVIVIVPLHDKTTCIICGPDDVDTV